MGKKAGKVPPKEPESDSDEGLDTEDEMERALVEQMQKEKAAAEAKEGGSDLAEGRENVPRSINNKAALLEAAEGFETNSLPFAENLSVVCPEKPIEFEPQDDLKREVFFYHQAVTAVKLAREELQKNNVPYHRPADFFAEMLKSDQHMTRVKDRLLKEKQKMESVEKRRSIQSQKKISKQVQEEVKRDKQAQKKNAAAKIQDWRKQQAKKRGGDGLLADKDDGLEDAISEMTQTRKRTLDSDSNQRNRKREAADKKFGHGGKKRGSKRPDAKSFSEGNRDWSTARNNAAKSTGEGGGRRKKTSSKPNRPGKARRAASRTA